MEYVEGDVLISAIFLIDFAVRGDPFSVLGIITHAADAIIPAMSVQLPSKYTYAMNLVSKINTAICAYCCLRIVRDPNADVYKFFIFVELFILCFHLLLMVLRNVSLQMLRVALLQGTHWGLAMHDWWTQVVMDFNDTKNQFVQDMKDAERLREIRQRRKRTRTNLPH